MGSQHRFTGNIAAGLIDGAEEIALSMEQQVLRHLSAGDIDNPAEWVRLSGRILENTRRLRSLTGSLRDINEGRSRT